MALTEYRDSTSNLSVLAGYTQGRKTLQGTQVPETTDSFPIRINIFYLCREKHSHGQRNRSRNKTGERIRP